MLAIIGVLFPKLIRTFLLVDIAEWLVFEFFLEVTEIVSFDYMSQHLDIRYAFVGK